MNEPKKKDLTEDQARYLLVEPRRSMLVRHGYDPDALPSGVSGRDKRAWRTSEGYLLRPHVCKLDGVLVDGHEVSDLDLGGGCLHCDADPIPEDEW